MISAVCARGAVCVESLSSARKRADEQVEGGGRGGATAAAEGVEELNCGGQLARRDEGVQQRVQRPRRRPQPRGAEGGEEGGGLVRAVGPKKGLQYHVEEGQVGGGAAPAQARTQLRGEAACARHLARLQQGGEQHSARPVVGAHEAVQRERLHRAALTRERHHERGRLARVRYAAGPVESGERLGRLVEPSVAPQPGGQRVEGGCARQLVVVAACHEHLAREAASASRAQVVHERRHLRRCHALHAAHESSAMRGALERG
mmetsp:Transcript_21699/g.69277  ORF Transcript_21699/g.69277 Transcript_21699/m.69277 type:complete len:261 (-) Transcript_21699:126-908(-)